MTRFLAALFLLVLLVESAPWVPMQTSGCTMPCCKRSGGQACCPRPSSLRRQDGAGGVTCRMVACDAQARESTSIRLHLPAILDGPIALLHPSITRSGFGPGAARPRKLAEDPPTPP